MTVALNLKHILKMQQSVSRIIFGASWGTSVNWLEPKIEPAKAVLACPDPCIWQRTYYLVFFNQYCVKMSRVNKAIESPELKRRYFWGKLISVNINYIYVCITA